MTKPTKCLSILFLVSESFSNIISHQQYLQFSIFQDLGHTYAHRRKQEKLVQISILDAFQLLCKSLSQTENVDMSQNSFFFVTPSLNVFL